MHHSVPTAEEIHKLDCLLQKLVDQQSFIQAHDLVECAGYTKVGPRIEREFEYLLTFYGDCAAARIKLLPDNYMAYYNDNTLRFHKNGGFKAYFERLKEQQEVAAVREALSLDKTRMEIELTKKTLKDYPYTKWAARIGFFISVVLAGIELYKLFLT